MFVGLNTWLNPYHVNEHLAKWMKSFYFDLDYVCLMKLSDTHIIFHYPFKYQQLFFYY